MYTDFTIKNFRIFDQEGATVPLRPITILTGCNNTGKSSIVKALCLLKSFCQQIECDHEDGKKIHLENYKMDFHTAPNNLLGGFNFVLHHTAKNTEVADDSDSTQNNKNIAIEIIAESSWFLQDVVLHLEFGTLPYDELNNAYLHAYAIKTLEGNVIYETKRDGKISMDFSIVKKQLLHFLYGQFALSRWQNEIGYRNMTQTYPSEDKEQELVNESMDALIDDLGHTEFLRLLEWQVSHCHRTWKDGTEGVCGQLLKGVLDYSVAINSPKLNVWCYFPCFDVFKDIKKEDVRREISMRLESLDEPISSFDQKIVNLFLESFETSNAETLHDFMSEEENSKFFAYSTHSIKNGFDYPCLVWNKTIGCHLLDESSLPETANWEIILYALDLINKVTMSSTDSMLSFDEVNETWMHKMEVSIDDFIRSAIEEMFVNILPGAIEYSPTTITYPQRLYSLEENNDFARTLKKYFEAKRSFEEKKNTGRYHYTVRKEVLDYRSCMFINKWMKQLGIADHIEIKTHADGYGVTIHLYQSEEDTVGMHLVDKGFGVLQLFAVFLKIEIAILETMTSEILYKYNTTGLNKEIIQYLRTHNQLHPATVALEEPECHLHPSLQSKFADLIVNANKEYGIDFLVESHSEYFIRKLQLLVSQKEIENNKISLLYINPSSRPSYLPIITDVGLETDGTLKNVFGTGFFDESLRLSKKLFKPKTDEDEEQA